MKDPVHINLFFGVSRGISRMYTKLQGSEDYVNLWIGCWVGPSATLPRFEPQIVKLVA